jgi:hypothetical protein
MATVTSNTKGLSVEGKVIREIENGKKKADVCRDLVSKLYDLNDLEKQNQNY